MPNYPDVNGVRTSYCSIELGIDGLKLVGVTAINYKETGEIPKIKGTSPKPVGRTRGMVDFEGDLEMLQEEWDELLVKLTRNGTIGYMEEAWPVSVTYAEPSQPSKTKTDRLIGVRFHSAEKSNSEGADALSVKLQMSIMDIVWNNKYVALRFAR